MKRLVGVEYLLRRNLGNYEHSEIKIIDSVEKGEEVAGIKEIMDLAYNSLYGEVTVETSAPSQKVEKPKKEAPKEEKKVEEKKVEEKKVEAPKEEKKVEDKEEEAPKEEKKEEKKGEKKPRKPETTLKVDKSVTVYDRTHKPHKTLVGEHLNKNFPNWSKPPLLTKAVEASHKMNGKPMLDKEGNLLESFIEEFNSYMA